MLNGYVWNLYAQSLVGRRVINQAFPRFARIGRQLGAEGWRTQLNPTIPVMLEDLTQPNQDWKLGEPISLRALLFQWFEGIADSDFEQQFLALLEGDGLLYSWEEEELPGKNCWAGFGGEDQPLEVAARIGVVSTVLHRLQAESFIPYYFEGRFNLLVDICRIFDIPLPPIPGKLQKKERALFYLEINRALQEFRKSHALNPQELNAFLYDFAPAYLAAEQDVELPEPRRVWFLMAGVGSEADFDFLDKASLKTESLWRGHRDARRGDIAILWCSSPRAYLHSVWRVIEDGHDDPFAYWYSLVRVGQPQSVPQLKIKDMKANPVLAESPMVRAHFQGCAGKYFRPIDYAALLKEFRRRGMEIDKLPRILTPRLPPSLVGKEIANERDVEVNLIEPLLFRLGYRQECDWKRQVTVRMGRGEKVYPDYVIGLQAAPDQEHAQLIVESKFRIATLKDLNEAFSQGRSYALRLQARHLILAALEGVWLIDGNGGFCLQNIVHWNWEQLLDDVNFAAVDKLIGRRSVLG